MNHFIKKFFLVISLSLVTYTHTSNEPVQQTPFKIGITVNTNTSSASASDAAAAATQTFAATIMASFNQTMKNALDPETYRNFRTNLRNLLYEYRYPVAGVTLLGTYSVVTGLLLVDYYHRLHSTELWGRWKGECSFEDLCTMSQKTLTQELLHEINTQYYKKDNPTDFAYPLIAFLSAIDNEISTCKRYLSITKTIKRLRLTSVFPTSDAKIDEIEKVLARSLFIKHLFLAWLAEFNIAVANNQKAERSE